MKVQAIGLPLDTLRRALLTSDSVVALRCGCDGWMETSAYIGDVDLFELPLQAKGMETERWLLRLITVSMHGLGWKPSMRWYDV